MEDTITVINMHSFLKEWLAFLSGYDNARLSLVCSLKFQHPKCKMFAHISGYVVDLMKFARQLHCFSFYKKWLKLALAPLAFYRTAKYNSPPLPRSHFKHIAKDKRQIISPISTDKFIAFWSQFSPGQSPITPTWVTKKNKSLKKTNQKLKLLLAW